MTDLKELALDEARAFLKVWLDANCDGTMDVQLLAAAMLRFAAKVNGEACIHQVADELERKP